jgi:hypothetical protein
MLTSLLLFQAATAPPNTYTPPPPPPPGYVYPGQPGGYGPPPPAGPYPAGPYPGQPPPPGYDGYAAPPAPPPPQPPREWIIRFHIGMGGVAQSEENDALAKEGYGGSPRFIAMVDGTWMASEYFGIGAWGSYGHRTKQPSTGSPELRETTWMLGLQAPIVFGSRSNSFRLMLTPRLARAWSTLSLGNGGTSNPGWAYGGDLGIYSPRLHFGAAMGYLAAPTSAPGDLGRPYDLGGLYFLIGGMIDG